MTLLIGEAALRDAVVPTAVPRLHIAPSTMDLSGLELRLGSTRDRAFRLRDAIAALNTNATEDTDYTYVLIDCPPSLNLLTVNAMAASSAILVPLQCEAGIDFSDEGDVSTELIAPALEKLKVLLGEIQEVLAAQGRSERLREGLVVAIAGPPNVGKSTLMNALAQREVAIVSPHAGTTRDVIEVQLDLDGYPVTVIDTAGVRETDDPVEQEGVRRARARAAEADLVLWLVDARHEMVLPEDATSAWVVRNKIDLDGERAVTGSSTRHAASGPESGGTVYGISASRGDGIRELVTALVGFARDYFGSGEGGLIGRERQRKLLQQTVLSLQRSILRDWGGRRTCRGGIAGGGSCAGSVTGPGRRRGHPGCHFPWEFCIGK